MGSEHVEGESHMWYGVGGWDASCILDSVYAGRGPANEKIGMQASEELGEFMQVIGK